MLTSTLNTNTLLILLQHQSSNPIIVVDNNDNNDDNDNNDNNDNNNDNDGCAGRGVQRQNKSRK